MIYGAVLDTASHGRSVVYVTPSPEQAEILSGALNLYGAGALTYGSNVVVPVRRYW